MAQNLHINILAKDRTKQALGAVQAGLGRLKGAVFSIQSALLGVGGALVIRSLTKVGSEVENLKIRFAFLFKGMKEGNKAFDELIDFAAKVPFSLEEISTASGNLAVVSKDAKELAEVLAVTGNVAVVTGLDFRQTGEQIQRAFSGGIAAADVFRERGVRDLLGFEAGAKKTAKQTKEAFFKTFGPDGEFGKAMEVMATTFTGTLSMLSDKLFKFKLQTDQAGFFDFVKNALAVINQMIEKNEKILVSFAQKSSTMLISVIKNSLLGGAVLIDLFRPVFVYIAGALKGTFDIVRSLPPGVRELGIIGFLMLGRKGKLLVLVIGGTIDIIKKQLADLMVGFADFNQSILDFRKKWHLVTKSGAKEIQEMNDDIRKTAEEISKPMEEIADNLQKNERYTEDWMILTKKLNKFFEDVNVNIVVSQEQLRKLLERIKGADESTESWSISMTSVAEIIQEQLKKGLDNINQTIAKEIVGGIKSWSKGMAEVLVLGKELGETMKAIAQKFIVNLVAKAIELVSLYALMAFFKKMGWITDQDDATVMKEKIDLEKKDLAILSTKLAVETAITRQKLAQNAAMGGGGGGSKLGMILSFASMFKQHGGAVGKGQPKIVGERGPELFLPNTSGQITQNARGTGGGSTNVNFSITTLDASGFSEMLVQNRGTISAIINQAVNERGASNIV